jgi:hypothetical protein
LKNREGAISQLPSRIRLFLPTVVLGAALTAGMAVALSWLLLGHAQRTPARGATADALEEGLSELYGAALGLLLGSAFVALLSRGTSRLLLGVLAGSLAYVAVLAPVLVETRPSDMSASEAIDSALFFGVPALLVILIGAGIGTAMRETLAAVRR